MKTQLTKEIEKCALKEFAAMGNFLCPEVGINIKRYGFPKKWYGMCKLTEQEMIDKGFHQCWHTDTEIVDILQWQSNKNIWKCYEIKISYNDFKSKSSKTFVGNYNYFIVPESLYIKIIDEVPDNVGVYIYKEQEPTHWYEKRLICKKKSKRIDLGCTEQEINYGMIKSLYRESKK